jgi:hypothetical protein
VDLSVSVVDWQVCRTDVVWIKNSDDKVYHDAFLRLLYQLSYLPGSRVGLEPTTNGVMRAFIEKGGKQMADKWWGNNPVLSN